MTHLPPAKKGKGAKLKPRVMWLHQPTGTTDIRSQGVYHMKCYGDPRPVLVIPLGEVGELEAAALKAASKYVASSAHPKSREGCCKYVFASIFGLPRARLGKGRK